jgi:hypothetical protein
MCARVTMCARIIMSAHVIRTACVVVALGVQGVASQAAPVRAGSPPKLNVDPSCEAAGRGSVMLGRNKEACLADETTAQGTLTQNWSKYSASDKTQCVGMAKTGGPASYVELLSCLEIMRDARNIRNGDALETDDPTISTRRRGRK